jgi:scyllo-inositol 2-dehydrogenase (NAD+)
MKLTYYKKSTCKKEVTKVVKVALLSKWHVHADDYARQANQNKHLEIKVVWDENAERGKEWAGKLGVPFEQDLIKVLADSEIEAVIVDTPTNLHKEIILLSKKIRNIFLLKKYWPLRWKIVMRFMMQSKKIT